MTSSSSTYLTQLHELLNEHFGLADIRDICFRLNVDYESVAGEEKPSRIRELLLALGRNGRLPNLITLAQKLRPKVDWPPVPDGFQLPESLAKESTAPTAQYHIYGDFVQVNKISQHHHPYQPEKKLPKPPQMIPRLPDDFVPRTKEYDQLIDCLLADSNQTVAITTMLQGAGGFGKTTLASAICHDERIQAAFPDGILWVELGEKPTNLPGLIDDLIYILSRQRSGCTTVLTATVTLADVIGDRACLLVIDDVWQEADLKPFLHGAPNCSRLITTRNTATLPQQSQRISIDAMQQPEALQLLCSQLAIEEDALPALAVLSKQLGKWPILLKLVNRVLLERSRRQPIVAAIEYVNQVLNKRGVIGFDVRDAASRELAVSQTIEVSLDLLREDERQRYDELAIFPEDSDIPLQTVHRLWHTTANWDNFDTEELCSRLQQFSLLLDFNLVDQTIRLHDVFRNYLLRKTPAERVRNWHEALLTGYQEQCADNWWQLPDDGYVYKNLLWHMREAERQNKLEQLLFTYDWLVAKLLATNVLTLINDFDFRQDTTRHSKLGLLQHALQMSSSVLARDKAQLISQLYGRLLGLGEAWQPFVAAIQKQDRLRWLQPQSTSLKSPGGNLIYTLNGHTSGVANLLLTCDGRLVTSCHSRGDFTIKVWDMKSGVLLHNLEGHTAPINKLLLIDNKRLISSWGSNISVWDLENGTLLHSLEEHSSSVKNLLMAGNGLLISSCGSYMNNSDFTVKIWDVERGVLLNNLEGHTVGVDNLLLTETGKLVSSCYGSRHSKDNTVKVWDIESGGLLYSLEGHTEGVYNLLLTKGGHLISSCINNDHTIKVWDVENGTLLHNLEGHTEGVTNLLLSNNSRLVSSCSYGSDYSVKVWDIEEGILLHSLDGHIDGVNTLRLTKTGQLISSCCNHYKRSTDDHTIKVWDIETGTLLHNLDGHIGGVDTLILTSDDRLISSCSSYNRHVNQNRSGFVKNYYRLKVWDIETGTLLHNLDGHIGIVTTLRLTKDGHLVSSCGGVEGSNDHSIKVWDIERGVLLHNLEGHIRGVDRLVLTGNGRLISSCRNTGHRHRYFDHTVKVWDIKEVDLSSSPEKLSAGISKLLLTETGHLVSCNSGRHYNHRRHTTVKVWDIIEQHAVLHSFDGDNDPIFILCLTGNGRLIFSSDSSIKYRNHSVKIWDIETNELLHILEDYKYKVTNLFPIGNDRLVVSCQSVFKIFDYSLKVWDIDTGALLHNLEGHNDSITNLLMTENGHLVTSCGNSERDCTVKVWDIENGILLHSLEGHTAGVANLLLTNDGRLISSCNNYNNRDYTVKVWDIENGILLHSLEGHTGGVANLLLTSDGRLISSCYSFIRYHNNDHTVKVWDIDKGVLLHNLNGHTDQITNLHITADNYLISSCGYSTSHDHSVKVWNIGHGTLLHNLEDHTAPVSNLLLTRDGHLVSSCRSSRISPYIDPTVKVWDIERGTLLRSLDGHISDVRFMDFLPASGCLMTIEGKRLIIWQLDEGRQVAEFTADEAIESYVIAPDEKIVLGDGLGRVHFLKLVEPGP